MLNAVSSLSAYQQVLENIEAGAEMPGLGLPRAARLPVLAALHGDLNRPFLLLTNRSTRASSLHGELEFWLPQITRRLFPAPSPSFYEQAAWGTMTRRDRMQTLTALAIYHFPGMPKPLHAPVIVAPVRAIMARTLSKHDFLNASRLLRVGSRIKQESLLRRWVEIGYQPVDTVLERGQFSRRGGILDVWPPAESFPERLDFFGDEIETLRCFNPATQRTVKTIEQLLISPAREILPGIAKGLDLIDQEVDEFYLPLVHPTSAHLLDYLPKEVIILIDDLDLLQSTAANIEEQAVRFRLEGIADGTLSEDYPIPYFSWSEIEDDLNEYVWLELGRSTAPEIAPLAKIFSPGQRFGGRLKPLMDYIASRCELGDRSVVVSRQSSRLRELWSDRQVFHDERITPEFIEGALSEGWTISLPDGNQMHVLTDSEIFGWERPKPRQKRIYAVESPESIYSDLKLGDWVVHIDHGIGRYTGLTTRILDSVEREFLCVEYDGGDQLFVPIHQADRLCRYLGADSRPPKQSRLGTAQWSMTKERVQEAVFDVAKELLELNAKRQVVDGYAFSSDTPWQQELEASFPYIETEDQIDAIADVKRDMESPRPMDRLLCGDVGYGKTEVALRAAFKAVMDGKQVAILVPTTVLAQQHYETFHRRLAAFPIEVEMLSRFRTSKEQKNILARMEIGAIDIVIGTHRLIQRDVRFKELGLAIIDEEQRFGVTHKEIFKQLRTEIDVLTMTATPIPRTLYMALTGVRDISTINTPPEERLPIITYIGPYSPRLVRQAIIRELERGGQVFFVHNRVQTIRAMESHLNHLVPEALIRVAHGQMLEIELADVMKKFNRGEIDVLLCTSIIESGLDIPNANTLIVDRGDTFGLAQLYQLRGRVGRGANRAYAYFFRHRKKAPTPEGQERLEIIAENIQLGAGYSIAMRDMEMRGAGEILGTRQHGYISSVGFHLYTSLLAQAVREMRQTQGLSVDIKMQKIFNRGYLPVSVDLAIPVGIPFSYVHDQNMRLRLYRRLADFHSEEEIMAIEEEFKDRFGPLPGPIKNLFYQMRVKLLGEASGLSSVTSDGKQLVLRYPPLPDGVASRDLPEIGLNTSRGKNAYRVMLKDGEDWQSRLLQVLTALIKTRK